MTRGPLILIFWLFVSTIILILVLSSIVHYSHAAPGGESFLRLIWMSSLRALDPGTIGGDEGNLLYLGTMLVSTLFGIFALSSLVSILTTGLQGRIEALRKGRSQVIEEGHTIVLGWSEQVFTIVSEISIANENHKNGCIAVLADRDKVEMEEEIRARVPDTRRTRIVCRSGSPSEVTDLKLMSPEASRSIIVLSPDVPEPDPEVIKTLLALNNQTTRSAHKNIVAMVRDPRNKGAARIAGGPNAEVILAGEIVARMTAQTCLQPGLSIVYQELLDFDGDEIYFQMEPRLAGSTFREALNRYETSSVIGLFTPDEQILLNPPGHTIIKPDDHIIVISEDDDTVVLSKKGNPIIQENALSHAPLSSLGSISLIIIGWNWRAPLIIAEIDQYVPAGSLLKVVASPGFFEPNFIPDNLTNLKVVWEIASTTERSALDRLDLLSYQHVIILSYSDHFQAHDADAKTIVTLLHCREIGNPGDSQFSLTSEMRDTRNRNLAEVTGADDFIVSDQIISLLLAQVSEDPRHANLFRELFSARGAEIYFKPVEGYVRTGVTVNFYTIVEFAARQNEVAIGYRRFRGRKMSKESRGVVLNPDKSVEIVFEPGDEIVVLSED